MTMKQRNIPTSESQTFQSERNPVLIILSFFSTRIIKIQVEMCERAIELLALPDDEPCLILDIGCGSGLSGTAIEEAGHQWIGVDISPAMLNVAVDREVEGGLILGDMGHGMPFKAGTFDGAISISALQWLCHANHSAHNPRKRLYKFFSSLLACLTRQARCVFQFYPENSTEIEMITTQAMKAGFYGGVVIDYPNSTKAKKYYLVLMTGGVAQLPKALGNFYSEKYQYNFSAHYTIIEFFCRHWRRRGHKSCGIHKKT